MRSHLVLGASLAFALAASGQTPPPAPSASADTALEFSEVVPVEGATKDQLYSAALAWFPEAFKSAKTVLDVQDKDGGRLVGKPGFGYSPKVFVGSARIKGMVRYSVVVEVKDGRYRYTIGSFTHEGTAGPGGAPSSFGLLTTAVKCPYPVEGPSASGRQETWEHLKSLSKTEAETLIASLKKGMADAAKKASW